ncbi:MAG: hypothetical protein KDM91_06160 [Verrucomicrobiae bacterium]|nr:hypothetical protein [Verrucomicrobiae bacterium]MCP5540253.1 hypothetical protein [Akkermansiaceae bacterium]
MKRFFPFPLLLGCASVLAIAGTAPGQDTDSPSGDTKPASSSLGDLFNKVKDLKVPDSVASLPTQLTELKESYLETAKTVETLRKEVEALREEVEALKADNAALREAVGTKVAADSRAEMLKPAEIASGELIRAWKSDAAAAASQYQDRYLKVIGTVESFQSTGTQEVEIYLIGAGADAGTGRVRCRFRRDANFHVEVIPAQGRLVSRNDRSTLLSVGQPVAVLGTCAGMNLDVELINCRVEGLAAQRAE